MYLQVLAEAEQTLREMAARKSTHAPFGAPWESWPTAQGGSSMGGSGAGNSPHADVGGQHFTPGVGGGLMDVDKAGFDEFDEFDDFLDMLEVGE